MKSNPLTYRSWASVSGCSISHRTPRFSVSLVCTRQSSPAYNDMTLLTSRYAAARLIVPPVGSPSRNDAKSCPNGAAAELSSGPRVQVLLKLICGDDAVENRLASSM